MSGSQEDKDLTSEEDVCESAHQSVRETAKFSFRGFTCTARTSSTLPANLSSPPAEQKRRRLWGLRGIVKYFRRRVKRKGVDSDPLHHPPEPTLRARASSELNVEQSGRSSAPPYNQGLSLSHDSVFSPESPVDESPSAVNMAELKAALRRRRQHPEDPEEEDDPGLPRSPSTSPTTADVLNHGLRDTSRVTQSSCSDGSLLSMGSSEIDEDSFGSHYSSRASLEGRLIFVVDNEPVAGIVPLNHQAAHHKISVRPKRSRPMSRATKTPVQVSALPVTPEVNEDVKLYSDNQECRSTPTIGNPIYRHNSDRRQDHVFSRIFGSRRSASREREDCKRDHGASPSRKQKENGTGKSSVMRRHSSRRRSSGESTSCSPKKKESDNICVATRRNSDVTPLNAGIRKTSSSSDDIHGMGRVSRSSWQGTHPEQASRHLRSASFDELDDKAIPAVKELCKGEEIMIPCEESSWSSINDDITSTLIPGVYIRSCDRDCSTQDFHSVKVTSDPKELKSDLCEKTTHKIPEATALAVEKPSSSLPIKKQEDGSGSIKRDEINSGEIYKKNLRSVKRQHSIKQQSDVESSGETVPEFLRIQLNKVEQKASSILYDTDKTQGIVAKEISITGKDPISQKPESSEQLRTHTLGGVCIEEKGMEVISVETKFEISKLPVESMIDSLKTNEKLNEEIGITKVQAHDRTLNEKQASITSPVNEAEKSGYEIADSPSNPKQSPKSATEEPELLKVFARRSFKVNDDSAVVHPIVACASTGNIPTIKSVTEKPLSSSSQPPKITSENHLISINTCSPVFSRIIQISASPPAKSDVSTLLDVNPTVKATECTVVTPTVTEESDKNDKFKDFKDEEDDSGPDAFAEHDCIDVSVVRRRFISAGELPDKPAAIHSPLSRAKTLSSVKEPIIAEARNTTPTFNVVLRSSPSLNPTSRVSADKERDERSGSPSDWRALIRKRREDRLKHSRTLDFDDGSFEVGILT